MYKEYDIFLLRKPVEGKTIPVGSKGVVLIVHTKPSIAYEVEFCNDEGKTLEILTLTEEYMMPYEESMFKRGK